MTNKTNKIKKIQRIILCIGIVILCMNSMKMVARAQLTGVVSATSANIREEASTSAEILASVVRNDEVSIVGEVTASDGTLWYQIHVDANTKGYIAASLITKDGDSSPVTNVSPSTTSTTTADPITTEDQWKSATIIIDSVRVREDASTSSAMLATVTKGVVVTVTGSKTGTDSMEWYQVSFSVDGIDYLGFIRSDLLSFDTETVESTTQVDGTLETDNVETDSIEEVIPESETTTTTSEQKKYTVVNTEETVEVPSGYIEVSISTDLGEVTGWKNGEFYILYATTSDGEEGWYRYDNISHVYQRYEESESVNLTGDKGIESNKILIYILVGAVALLFVITVFLLIRLSDIKADIEYADEEEYEETYEENYEDEEGTYEERREIRRNQKEDMQLAKGLEEVLETNFLNNKQKKSMMSVPNKSIYEDPEEYLKPDEEENWDDEFDYVDLDR